MTSVLVIEDEEEIRANIVEVLLYEGFVVYDAPNGRRGVQLARQHLPDLIICDVMMPELDGYGVLLQLRDEPATASIPFIFLTALVDRPSLRHGMELGADDYLTKPFLPTELLVAVRTRLEKHAVVFQQGERKLDDLRQSLMSSLPHEFHTPLTGIIGYANLMLLNPTLSEQQIVHMATRILRSGERLHRLVENYLLYAQTEIARSDPQRIQALRSHVTSNPSEVIAQTALEKAREAEREADMVIDVPDANLQISDDSLQKVIKELVDNALKFSQPDTPVSVRGFVDDNAFHLQISDHGRGMTTEQVKNVGTYMQFERKLYEQQGLGLGLVLAKQIIGLYGGDLVIESIYGVETTVKIKLAVV